MTVDEALRMARSAGLERLDAQLLLAGRLHRARSWLIAHGEASLDARSVDAFQADVARRSAGEPLAYITGRREFHGLGLEVSSAVLVPRPETETLVDWAIELLRASPPQAGVAPAVVDLGTGSGAIALAVKWAAPHARVAACDCDAGALAVAARNAARLGIDIEFHAADWWTGLPTGFDLALANPPYIAEDDAHLAALSHEPRHALTPGGDGLDAIRRIVRDAPAHLRPGGALLIEHGHDQAEAVRALLAGNGFEAVATRRDLAGHERCTGGRLPLAGNVPKTTAGMRGVDGTFPPQQGAGAA